MYSIYADGVCIYSDVFALESMKVLSPKLVLEDNGAGSLSMKLPPMNVGYEFPMSVTIQRPISCGNGI